MSMSFGLRTVLLSLMSFLILAGCKEGGGSGNSPSAEDSQLRFVPADTPYLFATGKPLPDKLFDKLEPQMDELLQAYQIVLREISRSMIAKNADGMDVEDMQRVSGIVDELTTLLSIQGLRDAGFERSSSVAIFGHGLLPVLRISVSDSALFEAAIARIEKAAGETMDKAELDGHSYRLVGDEKGSLIIATIDNNVVFTFLPENFDDDQKRQLLGLKLPAKSLATADTVPGIIKKYGYTDYYVSYIDNQRIASTFIDGPTGLDVAFLNAIEIDIPKISPVCKAEIRDVVGIAPRIVIGYDEITADQMDATFVVEMRSDLALSLSKIAAVVPGLGKDPGGLLSMGFSVNLLELRSFYEGRLDALEADPFECEYFQEWQAGVAKGREVLNQPIPPIVYNLRGMNLLVDDVGDFDMANNVPPKEIDASVLIAMDDAETVIAMGTMFSPELAALNLQPDGKPIVLDLPQVQATGQKVFAAMLPDAVALSVGNGAEARVQEVLDADSGSPPPVFGMTMDAGRYYALIADSLVIENDADDAAELSPEARKALHDAMLVIAKMYDRMAMDVHFTENGLEIGSRVTLKK